ncbi:hypothetical protein WOLCODRAFT_78807 [Wolfiporia cocos MD-104 SS10]|uniref:GmrSD restriction endonucleases N-terminal domain-containing protein n=1 Tax=Wolfiporia cocos (strain MD-104) TaxID=742152 RepID=A0A2H3IXV3_WOLCO|nr:hypothetical protein WOLCODRAFT_78807 [Wolfiporia cocos MD-104 SS10]
MSDDSDFEDEVPLSQAYSSNKPAPARGRGGAGDDDGGYKIRGALKVPRPTSYTTQALFDQMVGGDIDLEPDYQRDVVWPEAKQIGLIDSIFRNFYVPPLIFAVVYRDDGSEKRVSIDGKQRLTSIRKCVTSVLTQGHIMTGAFITFTKEKFVFKNTGKFKGVSVLPDRYIKIFRTKQIVCIEYQDLTNEDEREIFQRVQLGMALTPAEKLQAISSPRANLIRDLLSRYVHDGLAAALDWEVSRGADFRCLTHVVYNIEKWSTSPTFPGMVQLQKMMQQPNEPEEKFVSQVHQTFQVFLMLAQDPRYSAAFRLADVKKLAPVEFIAIATLIHVHKYKLTPAQLAEAIVLMRRTVRADEVDIRMNSRVNKQFVDFIKDLKVSQLKPDPDSIAAAKFNPMKRKRADGVKNEGLMEEEEVMPKGKRRRDPSPPLQHSLTASQAHYAAVPPTQPPPSIPPPPEPSQHAHRNTPPSAHAQPAPSPASNRLAAIRAAKSSAYTYSPHEPSVARQQQPPLPSSFPPPSHAMSADASLRTDAQRWGRDGLPVSLPPTPTLPPPPPPVSQSDAVLARSMAPPRRSGLPPPPLAVDPYRRSDPAYPKLQSPVQHEPPYPGRSVKREPSPEPAWPAQSQPRHAQQRYEEHNATPRTPVNDSRRDYYSDPRYREAR